MQIELPREIIEEVKQSHMVLYSRNLFESDSPAYVNEKPSGDIIKNSGIFNPAYVSKQKAKCTKLSHAHLLFKDNMSIIGILSIELLITQYIDSFKSPDKLSKEEFKVWHTKSETKTKLMKELIYCQVKND